MIGPSQREVEAAVGAALAELGMGRGGHDEALADVFPGRLFALRQAEVVARGTREVRLAVGCVVTPLARDHLKRIGVGIRLVSEREASGPAVGRWGIAIDSDLDADLGLVAAIRRAWLDAPGAWSEVGHDVESAARWVASDPSRGALLLAAEASLAVWSACQVAGVRAAGVADVDAAARAVRKLGANLLVVEPLGKPIHLVRQLGETFRKGGAPRPPARISIQPGSQLDADRRSDRAGHVLPVAPELAGLPVRDRPAVDARGAGERLALPGRGGHRL